MKIVLAGPFYPYRGGIASFNRMLYEKLFGSGHEVRVLNFKRLYPGFVFPGRTQFEEANRPELDVSERVIDSMNPFSWIDAGRRVRAECPDVVIFHHWHSFFSPAYHFIASIVGKNDGVQRIAICHNIFPHENQVVDRVLLRGFFKRIDAFVLLADKLKVDLLQLMGEVRYRVYPHPIYTQYGKAVPVAEARARLGLKDERVVLYFGLVREYKGVDFLLKAVDMVCEKIPVRFLIVGEFYVDKRKYLEIIDVLKYKDHVVLVDEFVPDDEVRYYFSAADLVVLPYRSATQSGVVKVAYNFDVPVVVTDVGGLREDVLDGVTGFVVPPEDEREIARAILRYYEWGQKSRFRENIKKFKKRYSWEGLVSTILSLVEDPK